MCGIHGVLSLSGTLEVSPEMIRAMGHIARHRGPDDHGDFADGPLAFGMQRLSIIDVEGGHQPIANEDETVWVVCNGEIYNFRELREELKAKGHRFRTHSDTEVVVHLYEEHGAAAIERLRGMFGLALWDVRKRRLIVARDRLGIKPLYYSVKNGHLAFASEIKSLLTLPMIERKIDQRALPYYLNLGYVPAPMTMFEGVKKLPQASMLIVEGGQVSEQTYWRMATQPESGGSLEDWSAELRETLRDAVHRQMVSDVPLGAFLSGGIDSSAVVATMSDVSDERIRTFAIGFGEASGGGYYNELPYARKIADRYNTVHREIVVEPSVVELLPRLLWHLDEPIADTAFVTTYLVAEFARRDVTVILSGVGGDELFGGYRRYLGDYYTRALGRIPRWVRKGVMRPILARMPVDRHSRVSNLTRYARSLVASADMPRAQQYQSFVEAMAMAEVSALLAAPPQDIGMRIEEEFDQWPDGDGLSQMMRVDCGTQLPDDLLALTDKMTMATSLECRVPLLDEALVDLAARMPSQYKIAGRELKHILKHALKGILPDDILYRQKRGFGAPMGAWFKNELSPMVDNLLSRHRVTARGWLRWDEVERLRREHEASVADNTDKLVALTNLEIWAQLYLDDRSADDVRGELQSLVAA